MAQRRAGPAPGDVLVSEPTARADFHVISVFPSPGIVVVMTRHAEAIEKVRELACSLAVDGWYTCDHTHYVRVAEHRVLPADDRSRG